MRETELVAEHCTCGAELPPEARFCHKCGKPQFELPVIEEAPPIPEPLLEPAPEPVTPKVQEISFRNRNAVRIGLLAATLASLLTSIPLPMFVNLLWMLVCLVSAGFFAVYLYGRRTGEELTTKMGARLGWMTGVFCFVIATILFTVTIIAITSQGKLSDFYREQVSAQATAGVDMEGFQRLLESPAGLGSVLLFSLLMLFLFFTLLPTLGGVMGAKVLEKE